MSRQSHLPYSQRLTFSPREAGALLGCSEKLIRTQIQEGILPATRLGKRILIPKAAVDALAQIGQKDAAPRRALRAMS